MVFPSINFTIIFMDVHQRMRMKLHKFHIQFMQCPLYILVCRMSHVNWCTIMKCFMSFMMFSPCTIQHRLMTWTAFRGYLSCPTPVGCKVPKHMMCLKHYFPRCSRACYDPINGNLTQVGQRNIRKDCKEHASLFKSSCDLAINPGYPQTAHEDSWSACGCVCVVSHVLLRPNVLNTSFRMHPPAISWVSRENQ